MAEGQPLWDWPWIIRLTTSTEFQIPSYVAKYASFLFSFLGRGICTLMAQSLYQCWVRILGLTRFYLTSLHLCRIHPPSRSSSTEDCGLDRGHYRDSLRGAGIHPVNWTTPEHEVRWRNHFFPRRRLCDIENWHLLEERPIEDGAPSKSSHVTIMRYSYRSIRCSSPCRWETVWIWRVIRWTGWSASSTTVFSWFLANFECSFIPSSFLFLLCGSFYRYIPTDFWLIIVR